MPPNMQIRLFICTSSCLLIKLPNSLMAAALMIANKMPNETGPPSMQPINTATKIIPVMARCMKLFFMVILLCKYTNAIPYFLCLP